MQISVVIPTCNRKARLLSLLQNLDQCSYPIHEVIVVDSGEDKLSTAEYFTFKNYTLHYIQSEKSVCIQRNIGIQKAASDWIFLCDDDIQIEHDYLEKLSLHIYSNPKAGAVSGLWLQKEKEGWTAKYPEGSSFRVVWKFFFQLSVWGEIDCRTNNFLIRRIKRYYETRGNHISKAGWPVITNFSGDHFTTPLYSLGAAMVKREWLLQSSFDEVLDRHGIGDNYGVIAGFPDAAIVVVTSAFAYHHHEMVNRLQKPLQYYRRAIALHYFTKCKKSLRKISKAWLLWSLMGNLLQFIVSGNTLMIRPALKSVWKIAFGPNPYYKAAQQSRKTEEIFL
jgi:glycosyltransferase involved in cell wall biosynthesis